MNNTTFERTKHFHKIAKVYFPEEPVSEPLRSQITFGLGLIAEEFMELLRDGFGLPSDEATALQSVLKGYIDKAVDMKVYDATGAADALGDLDVVINRFGGVLGFDMDKISEAVYTSNMSKYSSTFWEADSAKAAYAKSGREVDIHEMREGHDIFYILKDSDTGKILKSSSFKEPDFSLVLGN